MRLSDLYLDRYLYRDNNQDSETKDSAFVSADSSEEDPASIPSGGAAQDINSGNVQVDGGAIEPGTIPPATLDVSNWGWGQTCAFSSTDSDTVSWGAGTFTSANGVAYSIGAGNTGNMAAKTYIYLDLNVSETTYQKTTVSATAVGVGKVLIAVAEDGATNATYMLSEATQIVGDNIVANTIDASKITAGQLIVGTNVGIGTAFPTASAGSVAYLDLIEAAQLGTTVIVGGYIKTSLLTADNIVTGTLDASVVTVSNLVVGTNVGIGTAFPTASAGSVAYLDLIEEAQLGTTVIVGGYIKSSLLTADNIVTGTLDASVVTVSNLVVGTNVDIGTAFPAASAGSVAYLDLIEAAQLGTTVIVGGYIKSSLLTADNIVTGTLAVGYTEAKCTNALADQTSANTSSDTAAVNGLSSTTLISGGKIGTNLVEANAINVGTLSAITANCGTLTAGTISGVTIQTSTGNERIKLISDNLEFYSGGSLMATLDGTTRGAGGVRNTGDFFVNNNRTYWIASSAGTSTTYGGIGITSGNELWITMGTDDTLFVKNNAQTSNYLLVTSTYTQVDALVFSTGEYIDSNSGSNDMRYYAGDNHEFYQGTTIKAIIDANIWTAGDLTAGGSKPFVIPHPDGKENKLLRYTAQESPEVILRHRGKATTNNFGTVTIRLPEHYTLVTEPFGEVTVNLTPVGNNHLFLLSEPTNSEIKVESSNPNVDFHYEVMAVRLGYLNQPVELDLNDSSLSPHDIKIINNIKNISEKENLVKETREKIEITRLALSKIKEK